MNKSKTILLAVLCLVLALTTKAQTIAGHEKCGSATIHNRLLTTDPDYATRRSSIEQQLQTRILFKQQIQGSSTNDVYRIPVVVHVMHLGEAVGTGNNISEVQVNSAISSLNEQFRKVAGSTGDGNGVDTEIEFALAQRDPNCNTSNGIVRVNTTSITNYNVQGITSTNELDLKALSRWPNANYLNVWVVSEIDGNNGGGGTQGYAYFPGASPNYDGIVVLNSAFGTTGTVKWYTNEGKVLTHEVGHYLDLYHTFEGDAGGSSCPSNGNFCGTNAGDCCGDTPPVRRTTSGCPTTATNSCTGSTYGDAVTNYMDYTSETCQKMFSPDQKARMRTAIETARPGLLSSRALEPQVAGDSPSNPQCTPNTTNLSNAFGFGVYEVIFDDLHVVSSGAVFEGGYMDNTCSQKDSVDAGATYGISIKTGPANSEDVRVYIDYNDDGDFVDAGETVLTSNALFTHNGTITIPSNASGHLRLRVISDWSGNNISGSCYNSEYGQAEDFTLYVTSNTPPPPSCSVDAIVLGTQTACTNNTYTQEITVTFSNPPSSGSLRVKGQNFTIGSSPQTVVLTNLPANGSSQNVTARFTADNSCTLVETNLYTAPTACQNPCGITNLTAGTQTACSGNRYDQDVVVTYGNAPTSGTLQVNGQSFTITSSPQTVTLTNLIADASNVNVTAQFSDSSSCSRTENNLFAAPVACQSACGITNLTAGTQTACSGNRYDQDVVVAYGNAPTSGTLLVNGQSFAIASSPQTVTLSNLIADASNVNVTAQFSDSSSCSRTENNLFTAPVACQSACGITNLTAGTQTACSGNRYDQDVVVAYGNAPTSGTLQVNGQSFTIASSPQTVTLTNLIADGNNVNVTALFSDSSACSVTENSLFTAAASCCTGVPNVADATICQGETAILTASGGASYVWSTGATTASVNIMPTTTANYSVTITDASSCNYIKTAAIIVNASPTVQISLNDTVCTGGVGTLKGFGGTSYLWNTGDVTQTLNVKPSVTTTYTVTVTDNNGCTADISGVVAVSTGINSSTVSDTICVGTIATITASGGSVYNWSNGEHTPIINVSPVSDKAYTVTVTSGVCSVIDTAYVTVEAGPSVTLTGYNETYCANTAGSLLIGTPAGGVFTGTGVDVTGKFEPAVATEGPNTVMYTYTDNKGCVGSFTDTIVVFAEPIAEITGLDAAYCINEGPISLTASPLGGTFNGPGVVGNELDLTKAITGNLSFVNYNYTDGNGCSTIASQNVEVSPLPELQVKGLKGLYCISEGTSQLEPQPAGGTLVGDGIIGDIFDPAEAGAGMHLVEYTYVNAIGCSNTYRVSIMVDACTGLENRENDISLTLFPNPTNGVVCLELQEAVTEVFIEVSDASGRKVYSDNRPSGGKKFNIDASNWAAGTYLVRLGSNSAVHYARFYKYE